MKRNVYVLVAVAVLMFGGGFGLAYWFGGRRAAPARTQVATSQAPSRLDWPASPPQAADPLSAPPVTNPARKGDELFEQGRYAEAIPYYRSALAANAKDVDTWNDLGLALHYAGRSEEALQALQSGTKVAPGYQRIWLSLGFVALHLKRPLDAKTALERAVALNTSPPVTAEARRLLSKLK